MGEWLSEYKDYMIALGGAVQLIVGAFVVRWLTVEIALVKKTADERYEPKRPPRTPEDDSLRIDGLSRRILSGPIIKEFADNTVHRAFELPEFRKAVEETVEISLPIQKRIDDRVKHGFNNFDSTLSLALTTLGDKLQEGFRKQMSESQAIQMEALGDLKESIQAIASEVKTHIAEDRVRRESGKS